MRDRLRLEQTSSQAAKSVLLTKYFLPATSYLFQACFTHRVALAAIIAAKNPLRCKMLSEPTVEASARGEIAIALVGAGTEIKKIVGRKGSDGTQKGAIMNIPKTTASTSQFLTESQLAARQNRSIRTIQKERVKGGGIPFVKFGSSVRYRLTDVEAWEHDHTFTNTSATLPTQGELK